MKRFFLGVCICLLTVSSCFAKEVNTLFIVKNAKTDCYIKTLSPKLDKSKIKNDTLYSELSNFYYVKCYQDGEDLNLFLVCDKNNLEKNTAIIRSLNYKVYQLSDKDLIKTYTKDFNNYEVTNNLNICNSEKIIKNSYNPYSKKLHNKVMRTALYSEDNIDFVANKLEMNTKIKRYVNGFEFTVNNETSKNIVLKKVESGDFVGLTVIAKKAVIPVGVDFIPVYGIIAGAQTDIEKNKFTRPFPVNYVIKPSEKLRILALTKLMVEPILDFTFEIDGTEKKIRFYTYK